MNLSHPVHMFYFTKEFFESNYRFATHEWRTLRHKYNLHIIYLTEVQSYTIQTTIDETMKVCTSLYLSICVMGYIRRGRSQYQWLLIGRGGMQQILHFR